MWNTEIAENQKTFAEDRKNKRMKMILQSYFINADIKGSHNRYYEVK